MVLGLENARGFPVIKHYQNLHAVGVDRRRRMHYLNVKGELDAKV
jgi:hypothetical protein